MKTSWDFVEFMLAGAVSKTVASSIAYPHGEIAYPTRLTIRPRSLSYQTGVTCLLLTSLTSRSSIHAHAQATLWNVVMGPVFPLKLSVTFNVELG